MQPMKSYRALQSFPYGKKRLVVGEQFDAPENLGAVLVKIGRATEQDIETPAMVEVEAPVRASRREPLTETAPTYRTRHMVAEKPAEKPAQKKPRGRPAGKARKSQS